MPFLLTKDIYILLYFYPSINHRWSRFPDLVEKHLGCRVHVFDPAVDYIDHYYTKNVRFFNARLSDIDQQAQYTVAGEKGWKHRRFVTLIKDFHFINVSSDLCLVQTCNITELQKCCGYTTASKAYHMSGE